MELRQLIYFTRVVETMSFTDAAKKLYISQSTLSQQIKQLEDELHVLFFNRNGKHISLTEAGKSFYPHAKICIQKSKDAVTVLQDLNDLKTGEIRLGITYGLRKMILESIVTFHRQYPNIKILLDFGNSKEMIARLEKNEIDLLITFDMNLDQTAFQLRKLFETKVCLVVPEGSDLASHPTIPMEEVVRHDLIIQSREFNTSEFISAAFVKMGLQPNVIMEINDNQTLIELVKSGMGYTIMSDTAIWNEKGLAGIPIEGADMTRNVWAISLPHTYESRSMNAFFQIFLEQTTPIERP